MEDNKITSEGKQKNPKRVEQGKRLAAMSKEAKERKARERLLAEEELEKDNSSGSSKKCIVVGIILAGVGAYYVYNKYKSKRSEQQQSQNEHKVQIKQQSEHQSERSEKLVNLFD